MTNNVPMNTINIKQVPVANAWAWIVSGYNLFKKNPAMWIILFIIYLAIIVPLSLIPIIGSVVSTLLAPVFSAGIMWGCEAVTKNEELEINHLFAGFKKNTSQLIAVGGLYMLGLLVVAVLVVLTLDRETIEILIKGGTVNAQQTSAMLLPILVAMLFLLPLLMAYWFAPILVGLNGLTSAEAMKLSFMACFKNTAPFLLYGLIFMVLFALAIIPFGLGLLVVFPLMMTSLYTSYVDVFEIHEPQARALT